MLLTMRRGPRTRHPRHDEYEREVHAERGQAHCMARGDCPRSRGRHVARCFALRTFFITPVKDTNSTRPRAARRLWRPSCRPSAWGRRGGPFRWMTCTLDATWASCRSSVGPAGSCHCHGLWRNPRELVQLVCSSRFGWGGPTLHTLARHDSPASPRSARPTRRFPHWSQAARSRLALTKGGGDMLLCASGVRRSSSKLATVRHRDRSR
jgi:hypothetical protein